MRFELTRGNPIGLAVQRLNHSAKASLFRLKVVSKYRTVVFKVVLDFRLANVKLSVKIQYGIGITVFVRSFVLYQRTTAHTVYSIHVQIAYIRVDVFTCTDCIHSC